MLGYNLETMIHKFHMLYFCFTENTVVGVLRNLKIIPCGSINYFQHWATSGHIHKWFLNPLIITVLCSLQLSNTVF